MTATAEALLSWVAIGLAASIAGWIWPFRRGVTGILLNAAIAIGGAVALGLLGRALGLGEPGFAPATFLLAAAGALGALLVAHLVWSRSEVTAHHRSPEKH